MALIICLDCGADYQEHEHMDHPFRSATISGELFDDDEASTLLSSPTT